MATVVKRNGSYKITTSCGYDLNNKQIRHHMTWTPEPGMTPRQEEKELQRQVVLYEERCKSGQVLDGNIRFADFAEKWFKDYAEAQLRPRTIARYKDLLPRINTAIGHLKLEKIQPHHLISFYNNLGEEGIRANIAYSFNGNLTEILKKKKLTKTAFAPIAGVSISVLNSITQGKHISQSSAEKISATLGKPMKDLFTVASEKTTLSAKTISHYHRLISVILSTAVEWQVIFSNPCDRVKPPKVEKSVPRYLDEVQAARLLDLLEGEDMQFKTAIQLLLFTGVRRGELLGLEWGDIDLSNAIVSIYRTSQYLPAKGIFTDETKNEESARSFKIPDTVVDILRSYKKWQIEYRLQIGDQWVQTDRLFTAWNGSPMHPDTLSSWFRDFVEKNDLPDISVHSLRHTNATLQIAGGVPVTTVASRLGHATPATTTRIYSHAIKSADAAAAETLQNLLSPKTKSKVKQA